MQPDVPNFKRESLTMKNFRVEKNKVKQIGRESLTLKNFFAEKNKEVGTEFPILEEITLGADILFVEEIVDGRKVTRVKFAEINGHNSGNNGYKRIEETNKNRISLLFQRMRGNYKGPRTNESIKKREELDDFYKRKFIEFETLFCFPELYPIFLKACSSGEEVDVKIFIEKFKIEQKKWINNHPYNHIIDELYNVVNYEGFQEWKRIYKSQLNSLPKDTYTVLDNLLLFIQMASNWCDGGYVNSRFIEFLLSHKRETYKIIEKENRVDSWQKGKSCFSPTGYWILKPKYGARQNDIQIIPSRKLLFYSIFYKKYEKYLENFDIQVLQKTKKPDNAPKNLRNGNTFMRLRLDVLYRDNPNKDKRIQIVNGDATMHVFNRFFRTRRPDFANFKMDGFDKAYLPSEEELKMAMEAMMPVIHNLVSESKKLERESEKE